MTLSQTIQENVLQHITDEWRSVRKDTYPWGVWIRCYPAIAADQDELAYAQFPLAVWFLDDEGLHERTIWDWQRLWVVHFQQPWCWRMQHSEPGIHSCRSLYEIGYAAFAGYHKSTDIYLETVWGGLYGQGWRYAIKNEGCLHRVSQLWVS